MLGETKNIHYAEIVQELHRDDQEALLKKDMTHGL